MTQKKQPKGTMLQKLLKKKVYVKPLDLTDETYWGVFEMSILESFFDDWIRYGWGVACSNFQTEWTFESVK